MRKTIWNLILCLVLLGVALYATVPIEKQLRLGKDLRGGVTLTYAIEILPGEDPKLVMAKTIEVIKDRVDPQGLLEISIVPQGNDRIEITMPLPNEQVKAFRKRYEDALRALGESTLSVARLDRVLAMPVAERQAQVKALSGGAASRETRLNELAALHDRIAERRARLADAQEPGARDALAAEIAQAEIDRDAKRAELLRSTASATEVHRALLLSNRSRELLNPDTGLKERLPSPREKAIAALKAAHPEAGSQIDSIVGLHADYQANRKTLDDPEDLIRLLRNAGVLSFRIAVTLQDAHPEEARLRQELRERGARNVRSADARWCRVNDLDKWYDDLRSLRALEADPAAYFAARGLVGDRDANGEYHVLCWDTPSTRLTSAEGSWSVSRAFMTSDQFQRPAIGFAMDPAGARLLGALTRPHVRKPMAILLDDQVYTAPSLNSTISSSGIIEGGTDGFAQAEIDYIVRVLGSGSLQAKLSPEPISIESVGPDLGADNLRQGLKAGVIAMAIIAAFMIVYYFGAGLISVIALACTALLVLGAMALQHAAFTMAGIAGVVLTFGMAVDANVLIYERMREELRLGADLKTAVRVGFKRATASIVDGNLTTLVVCLVLASPSISTQEIRGFGITMAVGVLATMFSGLVVTRVIFELLVHVGGVKRISMLPLKVPALQRFLTPNIDWIRMRWVFVTISAIYVALGVGATFYRGSEMLDTQFRGGTAVTLTLKAKGEEAGAGRLTMTRQEVIDRVRAIGANKTGTDPLSTLTKANVVPVNPRDDGVTSDTFKITTTSTAQGPILDAIVLAFADSLDIRPALEFRGSNVDDAANGPLYVIERRGPLGPNIDRPGATADATKYLGGAAIVLDGINPPVPLAEIASRLEKTRAGADYSDTLSRQREVVVLDGDESAVRSAAILVRDDTVGAFDDAAAFDAEVKAREWSLARAALATKRTPASVQSIGKTVADSFQGRAVAAAIISFLGIGIYIWVRFKSFRYSAAAIVALIHDVLVVLGLVAISEPWFDSAQFGGLARSLNILPFKLDLALVAALLTVAGYSLNDTVIVMDRIRENKGKLPYASRSVINNAINQTISRTLITSGTTIVVAAILYGWGGEGVRAFSFALFIGVLVGTYSSIAIAAPIVWSRREDRELAESTPASPGLVPAA